MGSRLDKFLDKFLPPSRPRVRRSNPPSEPGSEPGCAWLEEAADDLELPEFPNLPAALDGTVQFSLPPIPRLIPPSEHLELFQSRAPEETTTALAALGAGAAGVGLGALVLSLPVLIVGRRKRKSRRFRNFGLS